MASVDFLRYAAEHPIASRMFPTAMLQV